MDLKAAKTKRKIQIAEHKEWREKAYDSAKLYKEKKPKDGTTSESRSSNSSREIR
jgi:hypothetical protein